MAFPEAAGHMRTGQSDVCKNPHGYPVLLKDKTTGIGSIMRFREGRDADTSYAYRLVGGKSAGIAPVNI